MFGTALYFDYHAERQAYSMVFYFIKIKMRHKFYASFESFVDIHQSYFLLFDICVIGM